MLLSHYLWWARLYKFTLFLLIWHCTTEMKVLLGALLFLFIFMYSLVRSSVSRGHPGAEKRGTLGTSQSDLQIEKPGKRDLWENSFDTRGEVLGDQDACLWQCQKWCDDRCKDSEEGEEDCLDDCLSFYGPRWKRCIRMCRNGNLNQPGRAVYGKWASVEETLHLGCQKLENVRTNLIQNLSSVFTFKNRNVTVAWQCSLMVNCDLNFGRFASRNI